MFIKRVVIIVIMLFAVDMFRFIFIPRHAVFAVSFIVLAAMIASVLLIWIYDRTVKIKHHFNVEIGLILLSVLTAMIGAYVFHGQSFGLTAWIQRGMYFYFFYFFLHGIRFKLEDLEKIVMGFGIVYLVFFYIQFAIFPTLLFNIRAEEARGTIRIFLMGAGFATLAYFMALEKFFKTNDIRYSVFILFFFLSIILQGTRQNLGVFSLGTILFFVMSKQVKSKLLIGFLIVLGVIAFFMIFQDFINGLIAITEEQVSENQEEDDIRIRAARFFLTDFFPNTLAYFTGNGDAHMASAYGMRVFSYKMVQHYYQSDVGLIGDFSKYGLIFLAGVIAIYWKVLAGPSLKRYSFIKYYFFISLLKVYLSSDFAIPEAIINLSIMFYMIDVELYDRNQMMLRSVKKEKEKIP